MVFCKVFDLYLRSLAAIDGSRESPDVAPDEPSLNLDSDHDRDREEDQNLWEDENRNSGDEDDSEGERWESILQELGADMHDDDLDLDVDLDLQPDDDPPAAETEQQQPSSSAEPSALPSEVETAEATPAPAPVPRALPKARAGGPRAAPSAPRQFREGIGVRARPGDDILQVIKHKPTSQDVFVKCPYHEGCSKTKSLKSNQRNATQGRPLGYLAAWCLAGTDFENKTDHQTMCFPSKPSREEARRLLRLEHNADQFFNLERAKHEGEGSEPENCP